jgi:hypothetical protein
MNRLSTLLLLQLVTLCVIVQCQNQNEVGKGWKWIIPLKTQKAEIEKVFGESITKDRKSLFQTYVTEFGKINVAYAGERQFVKECSCIVKAGTVVTTFVSPRKLKLSELKFDLTTFEKNDTFAPREISYFSEKEGILIATEIIELEDKSRIERVIAIEFRPTTSSCDAAQCQKKAGSSK